MIRYTFVALATASALGVFNPCLAKPLTMSCKGSVTQTKEIQTSPFDDAINVDLEKGILEGSIIGVLKITHASPAYLDLKGEVFIDELGGRFRTIGIFNRLTSHLDLFNKGINDRIETVSYSMDCVPKAPLF